jgi:hypothetical protein
MAPTSDVNTRGVSPAAMSQEDEELDEDEDESEDEDSGEEEPEE